MADATLTVTPVSTTVFGNLRVVIADITTTGSYRTGGIALTAAACGLSKILFVNTCGGVAPAADQATSNAVAYNHATDKFVMYEGSAAGTALSEKTDNEVVPVSQVFRVMIFGYGF